VNDNNDNPAYEMTTDGQRQKDGSTDLSSSKEAKAGNFLMRFSLYVAFILLKGYLFVYLNVVSPPI
jgi:hypothetical protein